MGRVGHSHQRMARKHGDLSSDVGVHFQELGPLGDAAADWDAKGVTWQAMEAMKPALQRGFSSRAVVAEAGPAFSVRDALALDMKLAPLYRAMARLADGDPSPEGANPWRFEQPFEITTSLLANQDSVMTAAIIKAYARDPAFLRVSQRLCDEIIQRDNEYGDKLAKGIQLAVDKKVLPAKVDVEPTTTVSVTGKTADTVASEIVASLGDAPSKGCVMTLQGLSGTGKGTTVAKLKEKLPNAQTWSNGNVFRSLTLLAVTAAEQRGCKLQDVLNAKDLDSFVKMLEFDRFNGNFDVKIEGLGMKHLVSDIEKTILKDSKVGKNIPTVAEVTQGEVVNFVQVALRKMSAAGVNVLLDGREQTLNHIRSPHRFELVLNDSIVIGQRQVALQMGAKALKSLPAGSDSSPSAVHKALEQALVELDK